MASPGRPSLILKSGGSSRSVEPRYTPSSGPCAARRSSAAGGFVVSSAGAAGTAPGRSRACASDAHQACRHVSFASPPVPGHRAESTIMLCRCSCHRACPLARRKETVSPSRGNARKLGTRRSMPPAVPHPERPATRYETCTSPNCEREAWRYRQSRSSQPPLTCSAAIHALGSGKSGKQRVARYRAN